MVLRESSSMVSALVRRLASASFLLVLVSACSADTTGTTGNASGAAEAPSEAGSDELGDAETGDDGATEGGSQTGGSEGCPVGEEGCPCTPGGGCDPDLACELGVCTATGDPTSGDGDGDGDPTTSGDGDGDPTTSGDGDGDPTTSGDGDGVPLNCQLDDWCAQPDLASCTCEGCKNDGICTQDEDCVCPDCVDVPACNGDACVDTGNCFPYFEGCNCADCANHPLCG
jgi:hypothetical protein